MEHRCAWADQARLRGRADGQTARALRRERLPAYRAGQMVSGRAVAALGDVAVLARGRRAVLARSVALRRRARPRPLHGRRRTAVHPASGGQTVARYEDDPARLRGHVLLPVARAQAAGERRSVRNEARRRTGTRAAAARVRCGAFQRDGLRDAARALGPYAAAGAEVGQRPVVLPRRADVPDSGRFADGLPAAARIAAVGVVERLSVAAHA